jgi:SAM-dependent methyltransferase
MSNESILYNNIGVGYNTTRQADPEITRKLFELLSPKTGGEYLDIGCGTGNYTIALTDLGLKFYGIEPSETMLNIAKSKNEKINWILGNAENIPLSNSTIDGAIATLTIHHWTDLAKAFGEIKRILRPYARFVIFTADLEQMNGYWLNHYFPKMMKNSIMQMPSFNKINEAVLTSGMTITGTEKYFICDDLKDLFLYSGKNKPEIYLDERIRGGISSFAALAHREEIADGLEKLKNDIASENFQVVKSEFDDVQGDYLFIIVENV